MSNVRIEATGEVDLSIAVNLGPNERAKHECLAGEAVELTVGGNQSLAISAVNEEVAEAPAELPLGVDVGEVASSDEAEAETEADPEEAGESEDPVVEQPVVTGEDFPNPFDKKD